MKLQELYNAIDSFAPFSSAAPWDNSGLLLGSPGDEAERILVCLDITAREIAFAAENGVQCIVSHHPVIFHAVKRLPSDAAPAALIRAGIGAIAAHTNLDLAPGGVNDTLCETLGLPYIRCAPPVAEGFLNIITPETPADAAVFARFVANKLGGPVRFAEPDPRISRIGVCAGSGADFIADAKRLGCDAFLTGDAGHHDFIDASALGVALFAAGHYETEAPIVPALRDRLSSMFRRETFLVCPAAAPYRTVTEEEDGR